MPIRRPGHEPVLRELLIPEPEKQPGYVRYQFTVTCRCCSLHWQKHSAHIPGMMGNIRIDMGIYWPFAGRMV
nr:hypothetical protein [uncultured Blautia sp.]